MSHVLLFFIVTCRSPHVPTTLPAEVDAQRFMDKTHISHLFDLFRVHEGCPRSKEPCSYELFRQQYHATKKFLRIRCKKVSAPASRAHLLLSYTSHVSCGCVVQVDPEMPMCGKCRRLHTEIGATKDMGRLTELYDALEKHFEWLDEGWQQYWLNLLDRASTKSGRVLLMMCDAAGQKKTICPWYGPLDAIGVSGMRSLCCTPNRRLTFPASLWT